jgi:hypothetical protein
MATFEVDKKTLVPFSKIVMEYLGTNNMIEVNRHVMNYYKTDEKNTSMFMNYVINCDAYVQNSRRIFNQGCEDLRLTKLSQTRMDQLYGEYVVPRLGVKVHPISRDAVIDFLKRTPEFAADTRDIVYTLAQSHYREMNVDRDAIPKHVIDAVIERHEWLQRCAMLVRGFIRRSLKKSSWYQTKKNQKNPILVISKRALARTQRPTSLTRYIPAIEKGAVRTHLSR